MVGSSGDLPMRTITVLNAGTTDHNDYFYRFAIPKVHTAWSRACCMVIDVLHLELQVINVLLKRQFLSLNAVVEVNCFFQKVIKIIIRKV